MAFIPPRAAWMAALGVALGSSIPSCGAAGTFTCASDDQCTLDGSAPGHCEDAGYCSFDDPDCPSGRRYGNHAAAGLAETCTPVPVDASTGEPVDDAGPSPDTATGSTTGDDAGATLAIDEGSASSGAPTDGPADASSSDGSTDTAPSTATDAGDATTTGEPPACPTIEDDFEDGVIDPQWNVDSPAKVEEAGGEIRFTIDPLVDEYAALSAGPMDMQSGWARAEVGLTPASEYEQLYLAWYAADSSDLVLFLVEGSLLVARYDYTTGFTDYAYATFDPDVHRWLQLRGENGQVVFETSPDGTTFETLATSEAVIDLAAVEVGVVGGNWAVIPDPTIVSFGAVEACASPGG